jgi:TonB-dependent starch-binding outer membrane protein SusC
LLNVDLPPSSGFNNRPFNSGLVTNRGIELEVGYNLPRLFGQLDLRVGGNLTTVRNRLVELADEFRIDELQLPGDLSAVAGQYRTSPGYPISYFYGYQTCGIYQSQAEADQAPIDRTIGAGLRPQAGDVCFVDVTGDGEITTADRTFIGNSIPNGYLGFNLDANFRRFDFTAFFNGVYGVKKYNQVRHNLEGMGATNQNMMASTLDRWRPDNPSTTMPRAVAADPLGNARFSDRFIEDASYLRLRTIQLGYTLPDGFLGANNTRVYLSAQNLFTLTGYSGYDPEFTTSVDHWRSRNEMALAAGTDRGNMPQPRIFQFGVSTSF